MSDETGIIVAGLGVDKEWYVLEDASGVMSPDAWARKVVEVYDYYDADKVIMESQPLGDAGPLLVRQVDDTVNVTNRPASKSKKVRAEPISALYQQDRVHHVGLFPELEDQLCTWIQGEKSPDRLDALVWAISELRSAGAKTVSPLAVQGQLQPTSLSTRRIR
jgi:phage terminase large subunit-like protein